MPRISGGDVEVRIVGNLEGINTAMQQATRDFKRSFGEVSRVVGREMTIAGAAITGALGIALKAAMDQEKAQAQLQAVLKSTAGAAGLTYDELVKMASGLQEVTVYGDDTVMEAEALLLTFTKIGRDIFPETLETVLDMSTALDQGLKESAIQVGKALQDPILGVTALRRVGVNFTDAQKEQIKVLVETNQALEAQKFILRELATEFGGSARAEAETFGGQMAQLKNQVGDLMEEIGFALMPVLRDMVVELKPIVAEIRDWVQAHSELTGALVKTAAAAGGLMLVLGPMLMMMPGLVATWTLFRGVLSTLGIVDLTVKMKAAKVATDAATASTGAWTAAIMGPAGLAVAVGALAYLTGKVMVDAIEKKRAAWQKAEQAAIQESNAADRLNEELNRQIEIIDQTVAALERKGVAVNHAALAEMDVIDSLEYVRELAHANNIRMMDETVQASAQSNQELVEGYMQAGQDLARTDQMVQAMHRRAHDLSMRQSPSILDLAFQSYQSLLSMAVGWAERMGSILQTVRNWWVSMWQGAAELGGQAMAAMGFAGGGVVPGFAAGGVVQRLAGGGLSQQRIVMVGERGPELAALPVGSRVMSNADLMQAVRGGGGGRPQVVNMNIGVRVDRMDSGTDVRRVARELGQELRVELAGRGLMWAAG